ncbi:TatD family hydrolase [Candidatus Woesearchaeota archaeon]|nr:TatD family hydrolase [Candidatus Woesearchaeota archaeon]
MNLIDVHAHLDFPALVKKLKIILQHAENAGVKAIVANGVTPESNRKVLALAKEHDIVKPALGYYPWHVPEVSEVAFDEELDFIKKSNPLALGEIGLDKKWDNIEHYNVKGGKEALFKQQQVAFEKFITLAEKKNIPLIVHSRKAELDAIEMLQSSSAKKIIMHCFSGKKRLVKEVLDNGWSVSVPVIVTKLEQFQDMVKTASASQLLTETDAPYLGPEPGLTNEPANVAIAIKKIAELKGLTEQEMADQIYMNYQRLFL